MSGVLTSSWLVISLAFLIPGLGWYVDNLSEEESSSLKANSLKVLIALMAGLLLFSVIYSFFV